MYGLVRILFFAILFILVFILIKRTKVAKKRLIMAVVLVICIAAGAASALLPVENLFVNFKSPEAVYKYIYGGKPDAVVCGDASCLALGEDAITLIHKAENGYKIATALSTRMVVNEVNEIGSFMILNAKGTNDYYIHGTMITENEELAVSDSTGSALKTEVAKNGDTNCYTVRIYGLINDYSDGWSLTVDGKTVDIAP